MADTAIHDIPDLAELIPLPDLPGRIPAATGGRRVHAHVPYRWASAGLRGAVLRTVRLPGVGLCTTLDWFREFTAAAAGDGSAPARGRRRRDRAQGSSGRSGRTEESLRRHGLARSRQ